ncbi:MAG: srrA [Haloplasmataceae bacterium]|jgi:DNA-binding response OmpR family regulator|nr:srrA [Haloplasmataceae bacterium]
MKNSILVAEDDKRIRRLLCDYLVNEDYHVVEAINGQDAIDKFYSVQNLDLIILDIMMPILTGIEVCKEIRKNSEVPIIFLTALNSVNNELEGFGVGADDYITKPFEYNVLMARINSIFKRINKKRNYLVNNIEINIDEHYVKINDTDVNLTPKEYELLLYLVNNKNIALSREQILNNVWGFDFFGDERTVDTHIKQLRAKLGSEGDYIKTIRSYGYKLEVK